LRTPGVRIAAILAVLVLAACSAEGETAAAREGIPQGTPRSLHTATLLPDGTILLVGGHDGYTFLQSAEIYDPGTRTFQIDRPLMATPRAYHEAIRVNGRTGSPGDDQVIIVGGYDGTAVLDSLEVYDPATRSFRTLTTRLPQPLHRHRAVRVPGPYDEHERRIEVVPVGNQILIVGGATTAPGVDQPVPTNSAFLYVFDAADENASICRIAASPSHARVGHTLTPYGNPLGSSVLLYGGEGSHIDGILGHPEIFDVKKNRWTSLGEDAGSPRRDHSAILIPEKKERRERILIVGGYSGVAGIYDAAPSEVFIPAQSRFQVVPADGTSRQHPELTLLDHPEGAVLISGGYDLVGGEILSSVEVFIPHSSGDQIIPGNEMTTSRVHHSATRTPDEIVVVGGQGADLRPLGSAESLR
jgi:hypothetical protein